MQLHNPGCGCIADSLAVAPPLPRPTADRHCRAPHCLQSKEKKKHKKEKKSKHKKEKKAKKEKHSKRSRHSSDSSSGSD
jgi:hypothetical protein